MGKKGGKKGKGGGARDVQIITGKGKGKGLRVVPRNFILMFLKLFLHIFNFLRSIFNYFVINNY